MDCIYCLNDSEGTEGEAHVFPEAVAENDWVLPIGVVCDRCNQYLGKLDSALATHSLVGIGAQLLNLPGKKGRIRHQVGEIGQDFEAGAISIPIAPPDVKDLGGGMTEFDFRPLSPAYFDEGRFRRALHHVAFNVIASRHGSESVLQGRFDSVRKYIREPQKGERWSFAQWSLLDRVSPEIKIAINERSGGLIVGLRILAVLFYVDLLNSGELENFVTTEQQHVPKLRYFGPEDELPRDDPDAKGKKHRLRIYHEE